MPVTTRCRICPYNGPQIIPEGPLTASVMLIGESPGELDVRFGGRPMQGDGGRELDGVYLPTAGIRRRDCYTTTAVKCLVDGGSRGPNATETAMCANHHLWQEIATVQPQVIVTFGAQTAGLFNLGLGQEHGIPHWRTVNLPGTQIPWSGWVYPTYSQNAGLSAGDKGKAGGGKEESGVSFMYKLVYDMQGLKELLETGEPPTDPYPEPDYRLVETDEEFTDYLAYCCSRLGIDDLCYFTAALDTESDMRFERLSQAPPWCLTMSGYPGTGIMVLADNRFVLPRVDELFNSPRGKRARAAFHNKMHDDAPLQKMGVRTPRFVDTLELAFTLGLPNKGLKYLSRRLLGVLMEDYTDVVKPACMPVAVDILSRFIAEFEKIHTYGHVLKSGPRKGQVEMRWPKGITGDKRVYTKVNRLLTDISKYQAGLWVPNDYDEPAPAQESLGVENEDETAGPDPWARWAKWMQDAPGSTEIIEALSDRRWEQPSIVHVDGNRAKTYASRDADTTLRLLPVLQRIAILLRRSVIG